MSMTMGLTSIYRQTRAAVAVPPHDRVWAACALAAAGLVAFAAFLPLWQMTLNAPQYPQGLHLVAYGTAMEGDLREINALNHYVGVKPIEPDAVTELTLFPYAIGALVLTVAASAFLPRRRWLQAAVALAVWAVPLGMLADMQWWLYRYGHDLEETAALRLDPFTPKVIGSTEVMNFHTDTMVGVGFWLMTVAALLVTIGPSVVRFVRDSWGNTGAATVAAALVVLVGVVLANPTTTDAAQPSASIAASIEAASPGDTVLIPAGSYREQVVVDKPLVLDGGGKAVIDGGAQGDVVRIMAEDVTLRGFIIRNSARTVSNEPAGIRITADRATIEGNRLEDVLYGIILDASDNHVVRDNRVSSVRDLPAERRGHALYVYDSTDSLLTGNVVDYAKDGVFLGFAIRTTVEHNQISHVRYGLHTMYSDDLTLEANVMQDNVAGASLMYSRGVAVFDNEFTGSRSQASGYGLLFKDVDDIEMVGNRVHNNRIGLIMDGAPRTPGHHVTLRGNLVAYNQVALQLFTTTGVTFVENSFVGNLQQVESRGGDLEHRNQWSLDGRGNYWDDYEGFDADGDGIGDIPYRYEGVYDNLVSQNEALRAYAHTPAQTALDLAARWFPVYRLEPSVVDPHPLVSPTIRLAVDSSGGMNLIAAGASLILVAGAVAVFLVGRGHRRAWA